MPPAAAVITPADYADACRRCRYYDDMPRYARAMRDGAAIYDIIMRDAAMPLI